MSPPENYQHVSKAPQRAEKSQRKGLHLHLLRRIDPTTRALFEFLWQSTNPYKDCPCPTATDDFLSRMWSSEQTPLGRARLGLSTQGLCPPWRRPLLPHYLQVVPLATCSRPSGVHLCPGPPLPTLSGPSCPPTPAPVGSAVPLGRPPLPRARRTLAARTPAPRAPAARPPQARTHHE